jgi:hypothetical protein
MKKLDKNILLLENNFKKIMKRSDIQKKSRNINNFFDTKNRINILIGLEITIESKDKKTKNKTKKLI